MRFNMEQSFWFDGVSFDKRDYPECELEYSDAIDRKSKLFEDYNLLDYTYGANRYIGLSELLEADSEVKWSAIRRKVAECESITILNDIPIVNGEIAFIADFYLKVFYSALKKENSNCYVYEKRIPVSNQG